MSTDLPADFFTVTDLYTERGGCKGCGECCSRFLPISQFDIERLRKHAEKHGLNVYERKSEDGAAIDMMCPFLDGNMECSVYEARPDICRLYRCDKHLKGTMPVPKRTGQMHMADMRDVVKELAHEPIELHADAKAIDAANMATFATFGTKDSEAERYRCVACGRTVSIDGSLSHRGHRLICNSCAMTRFPTVLDAMEWTRC